ncbi:MAG: undecaprenyl-diphosphate phosphatase [Halobacteriota archaeon]|nr:undecaprenyl-diphosphate phosphatase [Halobacteriota archaeon]
MNIIQAILLGLLQGITEWLPISSEGQSVLFMMNYLRLDPQSALSVAIFLHIGTSLAVLLKFRSEFISMLNLRSNLFRIVFISTLSTAITGLPLYIVIKSSFNSGELATLMIGVLLIVTGILLMSPKEKGYKDIDEVSTRDLVILGLAQGFSILPGISRSGTTIATLLLSGVNQKSALVISFLISVPVVLGAAFLDIISSSSMSLIGIEIAIVMVITAFVVGYLMMDLLLRFAEKVNFSIFCITLGVITIIISLPSFV